MPNTPRLALATPPHASVPAAATLACLAALATKGLRAQYFRSRARPFGTPAITQATGLPGRHLDSWLMAPDVCRDVFLRGARRSDLTIVEGTLGPLDALPEPLPFEKPGDLAPLIETLNLPVIAIVPCRTLTDCHFPRLGPAVQGLILDEIANETDFATLKRLVEVVARRPVLGAVQSLPQARAILDGMAPDQTFPDSLVAELAASFLRFADFPAIHALAQSRPLELPPEDHLRAPSARRFRVAYAQDEAFGGYYPDTLETLEALGAELVEFSPLRAEALPTEIDLVMIGCGFPDRHLDELAQNASLIASLRSHVCRGHRIYSEGGGTVYLGRTIRTRDHEVPGVGILPIESTLRAQPRGPTPVTRTLERMSWLGPAGTVVRGYRCGRWSLSAAPGLGDCPARSGALTPQNDIYFHHHAIGSMIHLHLASFPLAVEAFAEPHQPSLRLPSRNEARKP